MSKGIKAPAILIANDLLDGSIQYYGNNVWVKDINLAKIANTPEEIIALQEIGASELKANKILDADVIEISQTETGIIPNHFRERIKAIGPSIAYGNDQVINRV